MRGAERNLRPYRDLRVGKENLHVALLVGAAMCSACLRGSPTLTRQQAIQGLTGPVVECKKLSASEAPDPGRHHVGTPGDIISECPGDFVGIRTPASRAVLTVGHIVANPHLGGLHHQYLRI